MIQSVHCAATTAEGKPCRAWAMHGHTLCRSHRDDELGPRGAGAPRGNQNRFVHGFYSRHFTPEERASLDDLGSDVSLTAGIAVARIALRRVLAAFESVQDVPPDQASATSQTPRAVCGGSKIPPALRGTAEAPPSVSGVEDPDLDLQVGTANEAPEQAWHTTARLGYLAFAGARTVARLVRDHQALSADEDKDRPWRKDPEQLALARAMGLEPPGPALS